MSLPRFCALLLIVLCFAGQQVSAQIQYPMRTFPVGEGAQELRQPVVTAFFQDDRGILWLANFGEGLVSYDGASFRSHPQLNPMLGRVHQMCQDAYGRLWVGGIQGVVLTQKPLSEYAPGDSLTFTDSIGGHPLPKGTTDLDSRFARDREGRMWLALFMKSHAGIRITLPSMDEVIIDTLSIMDSRKSNPISFLARANGDIWSPHVNGDLVIWRGGDLTQTDTLSLGNDNPEDIIQKQSARTLCEDYEGNIWLGQDDGKLIFCPKDSPEDTRWIEIGARTKIREIVPMAGDKVLVATASGLTLASGKSLPDFQSIRNNLDLPGNYVFSLYKDLEQNFWAGTNNGMIWMPGDFEAFGQYTDRPMGDHPPVLPDAGANHISILPWPTNATDSEPYLLVSTNTGLAAINSEGHRVDLFDPSRGLMTPAITSTIPSGEGGLWIAHVSGFSYLAPANRPLPPSMGVGKRTQWLGQPALIYNFGIDMVSTLHLLHLPKKLGGTEEVLVLGSTQGISIYHDGALMGFGKRNGLSAEVFRAATLGQDGHLYIGAIRGGGLFRSTVTFTFDLLDSLRRVTPPLDLLNFGFAHPVKDSTLFEPVPLQYDGDSLSLVSSILPIGEDQLWLAADNRLYCLYPKSNDSLVTTRLPAGTYTPLRLDTKRDLIWTAGNDELLAVDYRTGEKVKAVSQQDGLLENDIWGPEAFLIDTSGTLYAGTPKGVAIYRPDKDLPRPPLPDVFFTDIVASTYRDGNQEIRFDFTALNYFWSGGVQYQTRLLGFDATWSRPTLETQLRYTNLPAFLFPREYTFEAKAGDLQGNWSEDVARYSFTVHPPWYQSWWFILGSLIILLGGIVWYLQSRFQAQQRRLQQEQEINERLRQIDKLKDQFLANTSHELRTPLSGIIGITEALFDESEDEDERRNLGMVVASGKRLASLVNDLLDFSRIQHADLSLQLRPVDLHSLVELVLQISYPLVQGKDLQLRNEVPRDLDSALADEDRITQVLHNLVGNAIKFTETGYVEIKAYRTGDQIEVCVTDTGIGISKDKQEVIFEEFTQADGSIQREFAGTGLGLSISRQLIRFHQGKLWVESEVGKGSSFYFTLPLSDQQADMAGSTELQRASLTPIAAHSTAELRRVIRPRGNGSGAEVIHILIVDDEPINHQVLQNHLKGEHFHVVSALNGQEALDIIDSGEQRFDLILLDVMMPRLSGYEVAKKIREQYLPSDLPIIMVTAKNQVSDLVQGLETGANDYLAKPFSKDEFLARMHAHLNLRRINRATGRFVPNEFIRTLGHKTITDVHLGDHVNLNLTVLFTDIRGYTSLAEKMTPAENFAFVNAYAGRMGPVVQRNQGFINQYLGDGIMALFQREPGDALRAAIEMQQAIRVYNQERKAQDRLPLQVGMGLHSGPLVMGIIGDQDRSDPAVIADTVNTTSRLEGLTKFYGANILVSETSYDLLPATLQQQCRHIGLVKVKGRNAPMGVFECFAGDEASISQYKREHHAEFEQGIEAFLAGEMDRARAIFGQLDHSLDPVSGKFTTRSTYYLEHGIPSGWSGVEVMETK